MGIQGLRGTDKWITEQRPLNWRETILLLWPNGSVPLTGLTSVMRKESSDDAQFNWFEKQFANRRVKMTGTLNDTSATAQISVDVTGSDGGVGALNLVAPDTLVFSEHTGEVMRVTVVAGDGSTFDVQRELGGASKHAIDASTDNPWFSVIGSAHMEGQRRPEPVSYNPIAPFNYTQIFRDSLGISRTAQKTRLRTGDQVKESKRETLEMHATGMERAFFWGAKFEDMTGSQPRRGTQGVVNRIKEHAASDPKYAHHAVDWSSGVDFGEIEDWMESVFRKGSSEKMAFCGNRFLLNIQRAVRFAKGITWELVHGQKEWGMEVVRLVSPFGSLVLKNHPLFNEMTGSTSPVYGGWISGAVVLDMERIRYRYLKDSDTKYIPDTALNGLDGIESEYLTECGIELHHPDTHFVVENFLSANAES